jgi:hypothetical protein
MDNLDSILETRDSPPARAVGHTGGLKPAVEPFRL